MLNHVFVLLKEALIIAVLTTERIFSIKEKLLTKGKKGPAIFLNGIVGSWPRRGLSKYFQNNDIYAVLVDFGFKDKNIEFYADHLERRIKSLKIKRPIIIGQSEGGLIAVAYAQKYGWNKVQKVIAVCTPFYGIRKFPFLGKLKNIKMLYPESPFLKNLREMGAPKGKLVCVSGEWDQFIKNESTFFPKAEKIKLKASGHNLIGTIKNLKPVFDKYLLNS